MIIIPIYLSYPLNDTDICSPDSRYLSLIIEPYDSISPSPSMNTIEYEERDKLHDLISKMESQLALVSERTKKEESDMQVSIEVI